MQLLVSDYGLNLIDEACNMSRHYFVSKLLQEISIIIILLSYSSFHASKSSLSIYDGMCDGINETLKPRLQIL